MALHYYNAHTGTHSYRPGAENMPPANLQLQAFTKTQFCQYIQDALSQVAVTSEPDQFHRLTEDIFNKMDRLPFPENEMVRNLNYIRSFKADFERAGARLEKNGKLEVKMLFPKPTNYQKNVAGQQYLDSVKRTFRKFINYSLLPE